MRFEKEYLQTTAKTSSYHGVKRYGAVSTLTILVALVSDTKPSLSSIIASSTWATFPSICRQDTNQRFKRLSTIYQINENSPPTFSFENNKTNALLCAEIQPSPHNINFNHLQRNNNLNSVASEKQISWVKW